MRTLGSSSGSSSDNSGVPSAPMLIDLPPPSPRRMEADQAMRILMKTTNDLKAVLQRTALELAGSLIPNSRRRSSDLLDALADAALNSDIERLQMTGDRMAGLWTMWRTWPSLFAMLLGQSRRTFEPAMHKLT